MKRSAVEGHRKALRIEGNSEAWGWACWGIQVPGGAGGSTFGVFLCGGRGCGVCGGCIG